MPAHTTPRALKVLIIGAGTGGAALAHALKRAGLEVAVFERTRTREGGPEGYRVGISPAGSQALAECLPPELYATFAATCARPPRFFNLLTERLGEVASFDGHDLPLDQQDPVNSEKNVSRMTLRQVLLTGLEDVVQFGKSFTRYALEPDGRVTAFFEDGTYATGDLLVAADGTNSRVRRQYLPQARLEDSGMLSLGGKLPITPESRALLTERMFEGMSMVWAPRGLGLILHVLEFKFDRDRVKPGIGESDAELLARWPGLRYDNTSDYIGWGLWAPARAFPRDPLALRGEALVQLALDMTPGWHPKLRRLLELTDPSTVFPINIRTSVPLDPWPAGRVTLLGDAIHTMTPGRGVGANTALRDAALLCRQLTAVARGERPLLEAVAAYEAEMRRYGFEAVQRSREQMSADSPMNRPLVGDLLLGALRTGLRVVNAVPLRRGVAARMFDDRRLPDR